MIIVMTVIIKIIIIAILIFNKIFFSVYCLIIFDIRNQELSISYKDS